MLKVMAACLPFEGKVHVGTAASLAEESLVALSEGVFLQAVYLPGAHYVAEGYNTVLAHFLKSDCDKLAFVEHDVSWSEERGQVGALARMAKLPHDYVGGSTRYKKPEVEFMIGWDETKPELYSDKYGCIEVDWIPQGFAVASRAMVQAMWDAAAETEYIMHDKTLRQVFWEDWRPGIGKLGQDLGFCRDWRAMGGKVHVFPNLTLTHTACVGHAYTGNLHKWLKAQMSPEEIAMDAAARAERGAA